MCKQIINKGINKLYKLKEKIIKALKGYSKSNKNEDKIRSTLAKTFFS